MNELEATLPPASKAPKPTLTPEQEAQQPYVALVEASLRKIMLTRREDFKELMPNAPIDEGETEANRDNKPINWRLTTELTGRDGNPHDFDMFVDSSSRYRNMGHDVLASFKLYPIDYERSFDINLIINRSGVKEFREDVSKPAKLEQLEDLVFFLAQIENGDTKIISAAELIDQGRKR